MAIKKGLTLVEILIVLAIIGMLSVVFSWWSMSRKSGKGISSRNLSLYNLKTAMTDMSENLMYISHIIEISDNELIAKKIDGKRISYYVNDKNELIRASLKKLDERIIAKNIKDIRFKLLSYNNKKLIKFEVSVSNGDLSAKSAMYLRYYK